MTIFNFALKRIFSNKTNLIFLLLFPVAMIFAPKGEYWPHLPYGYQYFGILLLFASIRLSTIILDDRAKDITKRLSVAPVSYGSYLTQNLLAYAVVMIMQCAIIVAGGVLYGHSLVKPLGLFTLFVSFSLASLAIALAWISFYRSKETSFLIYMSLIFIVVILGGLLMPIEMFPDLLKRVAVLFPTYWLSEGLNWIVFGEQWTEILLIHAMLWLYTIVFLIVGASRKML